MTAWNVCGAFRKPKGSTLNWNKPSGVLKLVLGHVFLRETYLMVPRCQVDGAEDARLAHSRVGVIDAGQQTTIRL